MAEGGRGSKTVVKSDPKEPTLVLRQKDQKILEQTKVTLKENTTGKSKREKTDLEKTIESLKQMADNELKDWVGEVISMSPTPPCVSDYVDQEKYDNAVESKKEGDPEPSLNDFFDEKSYKEARKAYQEKFQQFKLYAELSGVIMILKNKVWVRILYKVRDFITTLWEMVQNKDPKTDDKIQEFTQSIEQELEQSYVEVLEMLREKEKPQALPSKDSTKISEKSPTSGPKTPKKK